jgi:DNA helicase II / ATP-dependent DNA helicase PcrA
LKKIKLKKNNPSNIPHQSGVYKLNYKEDLNSQQYDAVMHNNGVALVIAGAGTGKTRTLVYRVARLIEDGINPNQILLLTFTRKAASEMIRRASELLDYRAEQIDGGTFHSFALKILRQFAEILGYSKEFNVIDQSDATDTLDLIRSSYSKRHTKKRFPKKFVLQKILSLSFNKNETTLKILEEYYPNYVDFEADINAIFSDYDKYKRNANLMDYDDLLINLLALLKDSPEAYKAINDKYKYIMVDEYQDSNRLQHEIILKLGGTENNIMAVGDDAQSIYSFRGADYQNILFFPNSFETCQVYKIEENYRSTEQILNLTNKIINDATFNYSKNLYSKSRIGELPFFITAKSERQQSLFVAQQVLELREQGIEIKDMAILCRSGFHSYDLEIELNKSNIPYIKFGGLKFIETAHIKDLLCFPRLVFNPKDVISWQRLLLMLEGVGPATTRYVINKVSNLSLDFYNYKTELPQSKNYDLVKNLFFFLKKLSTEKNFLKLLEDAAFYYKPLMEEKFDNIQKRWRDIESFLQIAEQYNDLTEFINDMAVDPPVSSLSDIKDSVNEDEFLTVSTIHSAKGLEWKAVFILWATEGKFPDPRSSNNLDKLEEERRLFYVASTRAKDLLYIVSPYGLYDREAGIVLTEPSRFIRDIGEDMADKYILEEE